MHCGAPVRLTAERFYIFARDIHLPVHPSISTTRHCTPHPAPHSSRHSHHAGNLPQCTGLSTHIISDKAVVLIQLSHLVVLVLIHEIVELLVQHTPLLPSAGRANITQQSQSQPASRQSRHACLRAFVMQQCSAPLPPRRCHREPCVLSSALVNIILICVLIFAAATTLLILLFVVLVVFVLWILP